MTYREKPFKLGFAIFKAKPTKIQTLIGSWFRHFRNWETSVNNKQGGFMRIIQILVFSSYLFSQQSFSVTPLELDSSRNNALAWLFQNQNGDGSWGDTVTLRVQTTSEALQVLARYGIQNSYSAKAGQSWLSNQDVSSTDSLSNIVLALAISGADHTESLNRLLASRGGTFNNYSWGAYAGYQRSVIDTAIAADALKIANYTPSFERNIVFSIASVQQAAGSWAMNGSATQQSILATAQAISTLSRYRNYNGVDTVISNGLNWLHGQQKTNGGFAEGSGATTSQVYETAKVIKAIQQAQGTGHSTALNATLQTDLDQAQDFLISLQQSSGEWSAGVLPTLIALQMSPETIMADFDNDGVPDEVETIIGSNVAVADSRHYATGNGESIDGTTTATSLINAKAEQTINTNLQASGGNGSYLWQVISGALPDGVTLDSSTGLLSGTAQQIGRFNFTYQITDTSGWIEEKLATINIAPKPSTQVPFMPSWMLVLMGIGLTIISRYTHKASLVNTEHTQKS